MKFHLFFLFIIASFCFSCQNTKKDVIKYDDEIIIPDVVKNRSDENFLQKNGVLFYNGKKYSGIIIVHYKSGEIKSKSEYFQGKRNGYYNGFYENGNKWFQRFYRNNLKIGTHKGWYSNKQQSFIYNFNNNGEYEGSVKEWYKSGQLQKDFNFEKGKESGSQKMWQTSGKIRANFYTVNGIRHGLIGLKNCISVTQSENYQ
ncbi:hypothetical protein N9V96_00500 [Polaribacter sp.]|nr:hypothetical protein [Polaribacter sp.]